MNYIANAGQIVIQFVFGALIALVVLRVLLQLARANFYNPICQFLYKATNPFLMPLRKIIPSWYKLDIAGVLLAYALELLKMILLSAMLGINFGLIGLFFYSLAELLDFVLMLFLGIILVRVILSFATTTDHPVAPLAYQLTEPVLRPIRRRLPSFDGFDFSPMIACLAIYLGRALLVQPLLDLARHLA